MFWDKQKRQYRDADGNLIPESRIKQMIDDLIASLAALFLRRIADVFSGNMTLDKWYELTQQDIASMHRVAAAAAFGGFLQMTQQDHARIELYIQDQLAYLRGFVMALYNGQLSERKAGARAILYVAAIYATYMNAIVSREQFGGMLIYRRKTRAGDNCEDCIEYAFRGWQYIGLLPGIGQQCVCRSNCRCYFVFSKDLTLLQNK